jgi:hypothetical protein
MAWNFVSEVGTDMVVAGRVWNGPDNYVFVTGDTGNGNLTIQKWTVNGEKIYGNEFSTGFLSVSGPYVLDAEYSPENNSLYGIATDMAEPADTFMVNDDPNASIKTLDNSYIPDRFGKVHVKSSDLIVHTLYDTFESNSSELRFLHPDFDEAPSITNRLVYDNIIVGLHYSEESGHYYATDSSGIVHKATGDLSTKVGNTELFPGSDILSIRSTEIDGYLYMKTDSGGVGKIDLDLQNDQYNYPFGEQSSSPPGAYSRKGNLYVNRSSTDVVDVDTNDLTEAEVVANAGSEILNGQVYNGTEYVVAVLQGADSSGLTVYDAGDVYATYEVSLVDKKTGEPVVGEGVDIATSKEEITGLTTGKNGSISLEMKANVKINNIDAGRFTRRYMAETVKPDEYANAGERVIEMERKENTPTY